MYINKQLDKYMTYKHNCVDIQNNCSNTNHFKIRKNFLAASAALAVLLFSYKFS